MSNCQKCGKPTDGLVDSPEADANYLSQITGESVETPRAERLPPGLRFERLPRVDLHDDGPVTCLECEGGAE